jgi:hypothetical protein
MMAADAIDRHRRAQHQRQLVDELSRQGVCAPAWQRVDTRAHTLVFAAKWDIRAPERPS